MKNIFLLCIFYLLPKYVAAQEFAPTGAKWYYSHNYGMQPYLTYIESVGDTTINETECKILESNRIFENTNDGFVYFWDTVKFSRDFVYYRQDTVFHFLNNEFYPLYVFNANKTDTILVKVAGECTDYTYDCSKFEYVVDSISSVTIDGQELKLIYNSMTEDSDWAFNLSGNLEEKPIIEKIGSSKFFFGLHKNAVLEGDIACLRCYIDENISYKADYWEKECDYLKPLNGQEFAPIGAKWYMNVSVNNGINEPALKNYYIIESKKDTLINSLNFRLVGDYPMLQVEDEIYYYFKDTLRLIYKFDVELEDSVTFNMISCMGDIVNFDYVVTKIDSVVAREDTLKRITCQLSPLRDINPNPYVYIERIGSIRTLIEDLADCAWIPETTPEWLRCYQDNEVHFKTDRFLYYGDNDCDYVEPVSGIQTNLNDNLTIFPNPTNGMFEIQSDIPIVFVEVFDITGKFLFKSAVSTINLCDYDKGTYLLQIHFDECIIVKKVIKN
ncbi:MAG: T9SS type A sorting domain-containing protein [Bacteroidales bacterium]|nr:T9SS type A sorting domain-containing protein [Bacteroidales bacterium]MBN2819618.1 T9SS type A sorting domain-containing protein [Bacteroidales bacterium]